MARPKCPKCENTTFLNSEVTPQGSNFVLTFVHCSSCGAIVGVMDYYNIGQQIRELAKALNVRISE